MAIAMSISRNRRRGILDAHKGVCHYCGGVACQIDHIVPKVAGGTDDLGNLTATCAPCNQRKGPRRLLPKEERRAIKAAEAKWGHVLALEAGKTPARPSSVIRSLWRGGLIVCAAGLALALLA